MINQGTGNKYSTNHGLRHELAARPWQIMLKFLPIILFFHSLIFHLFFLLFNPFFFSMYLFFLNMLAEKQVFLHVIIILCTSDKLLDTLLCLSIVVL